MFPDANFNTLDKKTIVGNHNYSLRKDTLVITNENFDFIKPCPCTKGCRCCGYNLVNLGFGCAYECNYCFLQQYQNLHAIVLPANINDFLNKIPQAKLSKGIFPFARIGSGEFTDSLLFDHITNYSADIVNFFRGRAEYFEFKTKSINIANLLKLEPAPNITVAWSVNPQNIICSAEPLTPPLKERLKAAAQVAGHGYKTAFHFDPVILHPGWRDNYKKVLEEIEQTVPKESILWISIGTLRFSRDLKKFIESRFKENTILDEEFLLGFDGKMRYPQEARAQVYNFMGPLIKQKFPAATAYLCMESADLKL
jgi:spore photoproduct lyase